LQKKKINAKNNITFDYNTLLINREHISISIITTTLKEDSLTIFFAF